MTTGYAMNDGGYSKVNKFNVMDKESMTSDRAEAARHKAAEVMAALKKGEPGDADKLMGKAEPKTRVVPLGWLGKKFGGKEQKEKKGKKTESDGVIR